MRTNKRVFVAAWEYPPIMSGESVVCERTLKYSKFDYDLCCGPVTVESTSHIGIYPLSGNKYLVWPLVAAKKFAELHKKKPYSIVMSRVMPPNGHLAGWLIKKRHPEVKWIAYFSDPVWNSPFLKINLHNDGSHRPKWLVMKLFGIPCRWALKSADVLMFNNERLAHYILGCQFDRLQHKVLIAPYGHEGVKFKPVKTRKEEKFRLTHVGQIYGNRTFSELIEGLSYLKKEDPATYKTLEVRQVGFVCDAERRRVENSLVADCFKFIPTVPYEESIEEMYASDCLLVIDPQFDKPEKNVYIPGKLFDYLSTGRPILCIAEEDSATGESAEKFGCIRTDPNGKAVAKSLMELSKNIRNYDCSKYNLAHCKVGVERLDDVLSAL